MKSKNNLLTVSIIWKVVAFKEVFRLNPFNNKIDTIKNLRTIMNSEEILTGKHQTKKLRKFNNLSRIWNKNKDRYIKRSRTNRR